DSVHERETPGSRGVAVRGDLLLRWGASLYRHGAIRSDDSSETTCRGAASWRWQGITSVLWRTGPGCWGGPHAQGGCAPGDLLSSAPRAWALVWPWCGGPPAGAARWPARALEGGGTRRGAWPGFPAPAQPQKAIGQDTALQVGVEFTLHIGRQTSGVRIG